ncbi:MAG: peptidyl-prolyl cis-trans isomerase [Gemmatimonadota bacterium]|nr:peptidyl-prolyl cis-trans isomerase [Gemmatimonadota bacterium]
MAHRRITTLAFAASTTFVVACDGLKEAFTAHVDVAARAGSQELSVTRLAELLGGSRLGVPVTRENAGILADLWANYQLMGMAAARGDSLNDPKTIDEAAAGFVASVRVRKLMDSVSRTWPRDTAYATAYGQAAGDLFAARHILFGTQANMTPQQRDSVRRAAEAVRPQVTPANFAQMAGRHTTEPGGKERAGMLGVFPRGQMVKPFSDAVAAARPGEISPGLVETQFGYHIVQRLPYDLVPKEDFVRAYTQAGQQRAESAYYAGLTERAKLEVKGDAPATLKRAVREASEHRKDRGALATFQGGELTVGRMIQWVGSLPNPQRILQQLEAAPDSAVRGFVRDVARQELLLREAERAKVPFTAEERAQLTRDWGQLVAMVWQGLGVDPKSLADSAKSVPERERLAAARVEGVMDRIMNGQAQIVPIPMPLATALDEKYDTSINRAGLDRATERAAKIRASADSARAAQQPRSEVPIPGAPGGAPDTSGAAKQRP